MARRPKPPRRPRPEATAPSAASTQTRSENNDREPKRQRRRVTTGNRVRDRARVDEAERDPFPTLQECLHEVPFCCGICKCSAERKRRVLMRNANDDYVPADDEHLWTQPSAADGLRWHRRCCHGIFQVPDDEENEDAWAPQYVTALDNLQSEIAGLQNNVKDETALEWVGEKEIHDAYNNTYSAVAKEHNDDQLEHPLDKAETHNEAELQSIKFENEGCKRQRGSVRPAVVLDVFAGIGTGIVCLKKLKIAIRKVIHVEHDKVATHVYRTNHDPEYSDLDLEPDGIEHVYVDSFEAIEKELYQDSDAFLAKYGPVDIIPGGPPCVDFSPINAYRQGTSGKQGQYMIRFGKFIQEIKRIQNQHGIQDPIFFLAENVVTRKENLEDIRAAFGMDWDPVRLNAASVSPNLRERHYYTNIPPYLHNFFDGPGLNSTPASCIDEGFKV